MRRETNYRNTRKYVVREILFNALESLGMPRYLHPIVIDKAKFPNVEYGFRPKSRRVAQTIDSRSEFVYYDPFLVYGHFVFGDLDDMANKQALMEHNLQYALQSYLASSKLLVDTDQIEIAFDKIELQESTDNFFVKPGVGAVLVTGEVVSLVEYKFK